MNTFGVEDIVLKEWERETHRAEVRAKSWWEASLRGKPKAALIFAASTVGVAGLARLAHAFN